jgi:hypothetical protein
MPYVLRHYTSFCDRIIINDDSSTDGTRELVEACPIAELRDLGSNGVNDEIFLAHWHEDYKGSRGVADWVILADVDEFLYHPDIRGLLESYQQQGITFPLVQGYNMWSENFPTIDGQIYDELFCGKYYEAGSKRAVFDPRLDVLFHPGRHHVRSVSPGAVENPGGVPELALLHYLAMGMDYFCRRRNSYIPRMSAVNIANNWGSYILTDTDESKRNQFVGELAESRPLIGVIAGAKE